jgi:hypothetical protein
MPVDAPKEQEVNVKEAGGYGDKSSYQHLQMVRSELDLVKCSEEIENDLLEASLEEYQCVLSLEG